MLGCASGGQACLDQPEVLQGHLDAVHPQSPPEGLLMEGRLEAQVRGPAEVPSLHVCVAARRAALASSVKPAPVLLCHPLF